MGFKLMGQNFLKPVSLPGHRRAIDLGRVVGIGRDAYAEWEGGSGPMLTAKPLTSSESRENTEHKKTAVIWDGRR
jgi:hypothetical protein